MDYASGPIQIGSQFGEEAANHVERLATDYCECERDRIELANKPRVNELRVEGLALQKLESALDEQLKRLPPTDDSRPRVRSIFVHWATGILLAAAAFVFSLIAFEPFRLGPKAYLYCLGIAIITPFATEKFLETIKNEGVFRFIIAVVFLTALIGSGLLAVIRGNLLGREVEQDTPISVIDGDTPAENQPQNNFYRDTAQLLKVLMVLLTIAIDIGAGIAIHRAMELSAAAHNDRKAITLELEVARKRIGEVIFEITALENSPEVFERTFWRDYYRSLLRQTAQNSSIKLAALALFISLFGAGRIAAQTKTELVIALDLSASETVRGHDGLTQFEKNARAIGQLLGETSTGTKITIIGITENSYGDPALLLSARTPTDPGYFGEKIARARNELIRSWNTRTEKLEPRAKGTDILGAVLLAGELFKEDAKSTNNILVMYSDMQNMTTDLDLEHSGRFKSQIGTLRPSSREMPAMKGVSVYILGASMMRYQPQRRKQVRNFWLAYFADAGATVERYSSLADAPTLVR